MTPMMTSHIASLKQQFHYANAVKYYSYTTDYMRWATG